MTYPPSYPPAHPPQYPAGPPPAPRYFQITLTNHTGMIIMYQIRRYTVTGTLEQCEAAYRQAQTHNLVAGWWGLISFFIMNWVALFANMSQINKIRRLAAQPPAYPPVPPQGYPGYQPPYPPTA